KERVQEFLPGCAVSWHVVPTIPPGRGGKFRHSLSEVPFHLNEIRRATIAPARNIGNIEPYRLVASPGSGSDDESLLKLDWNEGTHPPPRGVIDRVVQAASSGSTLNWYPDLHAERLKDAIARYAGVARENVGLFVGSDGALDYVAK